MLVFAFRQRIFRNKNTAQLNFNITAVSYLFSVTNYLGIFLSPVSNDIARVGQVQLKILQAHPLFIAQVRTGADT